VFEGDPFETLADCLKPYQPVKLPQLPPGIGGLFGFWGYELIRWVESRVPVYPPSEQDLPDGLWMQVDNLIIFDQVKRKIWAIAYADLRGSDGNLEQAYQQACDRVRRWSTNFNSPIWQRHGIRVDTSRKRDSGVVLYEQHRSLSILHECRKSEDYIRAGDIFQVVLSQRLSAEYSGDPLPFTASLRLINPRPTWRISTLGIGKLLALVQK
jgi:anthranilate synthase component 1